MQTRVAVVTGAGGGIGRAIAEQLARSGHHVIVTDLRLDSAAETVAGVRAEGFSAEALQMDVGDRASIRSAFAEIDAKHQRCDILVNNAGVAKTQDFLEFDEDDWQATLNINLTGPFHCSQQAARMMVRNRWGRIINISSISSMRAGVGRTAYGTSKAGLNGLARQIAVELAPFGVTANTVAAGPVDTELAKALHTETTRNELTRLVPGGAYGAPGSIAAAVDFLASEAADYVNGHTLAVDGGIMAAGVLRI